MIADYFPYPWYDYVLMVASVVAVTWWSYRENMIPFYYRKEYFYKCITCGRTGMSYKKTPRKVICFECIGR